MRTLYDNPGWPSRAASGPRKWFDKHLESLAAAEQEQPAIEVAAKLSSPHPLVASTWAWKTAWDDYERPRKSRPGSFPPYPELKNVLNIGVSDGQFPRAPRLVDALIKAFERRQYDVRVEEEDRLRRFQKHYQAVAQPLEWKFTRRDLLRVLARLDAQQQRSLSA